MHRPTGDDDDDDDDADDDDDDDDDDGSLLEDRFIGLFMPLWGLDEWGSESCDPQFPKNLRLWSEPETPSYVRSCLRPKQ